MGVDWSKVRYFKREEFRYDPEKVAPELVYLLDEIRDKLAQPILVNVAWSARGHSPRSYHYTGMAVDFHCLSNNYLEQYCCIREFPQIGGVGFYPEWARPGWHIDLRTKPLQWIFTENQYKYGHAVIASAIERRICR